MLSPTVKTLVLTKKQNLKLFNSCRQQCLGKHNGFLLTQVIAVHQTQRRFICHSPARPACATACLHQTFQGFLTHLAYFLKISGFFVTAEFLLEEVTLMENRKCTERWKCLSQLQKQHILKLTLTYSLNFFI